MRKVGYSTGALAKGDFRRALGMLQQAGVALIELSEIFLKLPEAALCLDLGHARQVDSTMSEAALILSRFGDRLKQLHVSEVNTLSHHESLSLSAIRAFNKIARLIPEDCPLIL